MGGWRRMKKRGGDGDRTRGGECDGFAAEMVGI